MSILFKYTEDFHISITSLLSIDYQSTGAHTELNNITE